MNIVIADDEQIILKWMKKNIEALPGKNHVIETCSNGKQVLNCCLNQKVDVLFTDIRMPVMDGMEMLQKLAENQVLPYTVILSAYDDFSYARDCFKLGIQEFILKSEITKDELEKCIRDAEEFLKNRESKVKTQDTGREENQKLLERLYKKEQISDRQLEEYMKHIWGIEGEFAVMLLHSYAQISSTEQLQELLAYFFQEEQLKFYSAGKAENEILIICGMSAKGIEKLGLRLYETLASFGYKAICVNVSCSGYSYRELQNRYQECQEILQYQVFYENMAGMDYERMEKQWEDAGRETELQFKALEDQMKQQDWGMVEKCLEELFVSIQNIMPETTHLKHLVLNFILNLYWNYLDEEKREKVNMDQLIHLSSCQDLKGFESQVFQQLRLIFSMLRTQQPVYSEAVGKMIEYMEKYYQNPISLDELAAYVHMNRSYVSHLFKKETGDNIHNYLLWLRLEKAKVLLLKSRESIQMICEQVGIPDSAYFSKVFKKQVGKSPLEFRKEIQP